MYKVYIFFFFFFQAEDGIRDLYVTGVQTCALPISPTWCHMHEYGTTLEQWAQVAVSTRAWAALHPKAMYRDPLTIAEVLNSRPICYPFNILNICLVTDA